MLRLMILLGAIVEFRIKIRVTDFTIAASKLSSRNHDDGLFAVNWFISSLVKALFFN